VVEDETEVRIYPSAFDFVVWTDLSELYRGRLRVVMGDVPGIHMRKMKGDDIPELLHEMFCRYEALAREQDEA